ncbi:hypothetical protein MMC30_005620 [Trapelia coarctata]|nr:hypothetical protein [Trapelia coarctata]
MASQEADCEIHVLNRHGFYDEVIHPVELNLKDRPDIPIETRLKWANGVIAAVQSDSENPDRIRPWCLQLFLDGTVLAQLVPLEGDVYPARFRMPANLLVGYDAGKAVKRAELFALGSLLYEIETGTKPFEGLSDEEVQRDYSDGEFPEGVPYLKLGPLISYYWESTTFQHGTEKSDEMPNPSKPNPLFSRIISKLVSHAEEHPVLFFFQATGTLLLISSLAIPPILFVLGFGPVGPAVGSAAAAWQSSIGLVQAGSLFAWCQSVAMGGAALNGILASAAIGGGLAGGATLLASLDQAKLMERMQSYFEKLKLGKAALFFVQANKMLGAGVAGAATAIASLDLSEERDTIGRVFQNVQLGGRTLNVILTSAAVGATGSAIGTAARLGEVYQGVTVAAAGNQTLRGVTNAVAGSATGTFMRGDSVFSESTHLVLSATPTLHLPDLIRFLHSYQLDMASEELTCRVRIQKPQAASGGTTPPEKLAELSVKDCRDTRIGTRLKWAENTITVISDTILPDDIRPWDLVLHSDGTVSTLPVPESKKRSALEYPARCRIPPSSLYGYKRQETVKRAEAFALGSLLYEIETGKKPHEGLSDDEVQRKYSAGEFPQDVARLKLGSTIYSAWSWEFMHELDRLAEMKKSQPRYKQIIDKTGNYAKEHPFLFGSQFLGGTLSLGFLAAPFTLGAVGFAATGPVAGSLAAAWQASMPLAQAGSLFSWLQGAAMGGPAFGGLLAAAGSGATIVGGLTAMSALFSPSEMEDIFQRVYRKGYVKPML